MSVDCQIYRPQVEDCFYSRPKNEVLTDAELMAKKLWTAAD